MSEYDPQNTILALNMAVVSVNRILTSGDRTILEWEYNNIINRLALGNVQSDPEIMRLYSQLLRFITDKRLRDEDAKHIRESSTKREQEAWYRAMSKGVSDARRTSLSSYIPFSGIVNWLGRKVISGFTSLFGADFMTSYYGCDYNYKAAKEEIHRDIDNKIWQLDKEEIKACSELQVELLNASWSLLNKYNLPNKYLLRQENITAFLRAMEKEDVSLRLEMLEAIEHNFQVYPPYWFFRANTALECEDNSEYEYSLKKFEEVWRPVLNYDMYKLEASKYRIRDIGQHEKLSEADKKEIMGLLEIMRENTPLDDWKSNLFAGIVYCALGDVKAGRKCIRTNINFGHESTISNAVLVQLERGNFEAAQLTAGLKPIFDNNVNDLTVYELKVGAEGGNPAAQFRLGLMYEWGMYEWGKSALPKDDVQAVYWYRKSAEQGNAYGQFNLARMYEHGKGVTKDINKARELYQKLAAQGDKGAQEALARLK